MAILTLETGIHFNVTILIILISIEVLSKFFIVISRLKFRKEKKTLHLLALIFKVAMVWILSGITILEILHTGVVVPLLKTNWYTE